MLWTVRDFCLLRRTLSPLHTWSTEHSSQTLRFCARIPTTTGTRKFYSEIWKVQPYCARHQSLRPDIWHYLPCGFPESSLASELVICFSERLMNVGTGKRVPLRRVNQHLMPEDSDEESDTGHSPASSPPPPQSSCSQAAASRPLCSGLINARVDLEMKTLWEEFHGLGTEMIVTKAGR